MNITKLTLMTALMSVAVLGCTQGSPLDSDLSEAVAILETDKTRIEVESASFHADEFVTDTLTVTSSRSWSLARSAESPWLTTSRDNGINLGKIVKEWPLALTFEDNTDPDNTRSVSLSLTIDGDRKDIDVLQKAFVPSLGIETPDTYNVPESGDTLDISIRSNCAWTAKVGDASTASVTLSTSEGYKSGVLSAIIKTNYDVESGKEATIVLSAENAGDVMINISQEICIPRLEIDAGQIMTDVLPGPGSYLIAFDTNETWTAALTDDSSEGITLSAEDGEPGDELFVTFPSATLTGASATVVITTNSGLTETVTFTQKGCLFIPFRMWPDNNGWSKHATSLTGVSSNKYDIPRSVDDSNAYVAANDSYIGKDSSGWQYTFYAGTEETMFRSEHSGLVIGSVTQNPAFHIEFPAVEGKTLKRVQIMLGNSDVKLTNWEQTATGTSGYMTDSEGNITPGGEIQQVKTYQKTEEWKTNPDNAAQLLQESFYLDYANHTESMFDFVLTATQPGTAYRYVGEYRQVIRWFILYYE